MKHDALNGALDVSQSELWIGVKFWGRVCAQIGPQWFLVWHLNVSAWSPCSWPWVKHENFNGAIDFARSERVLEVTFWVRVCAQMGPNNSLCLTLLPFQHDKHAFDDEWHTRRSIVQSMLLKVNLKSRFKFQVRVCAQIEPSNGLCLETLGC